MRKTAAIWMRAFFYLFSLVFNVVNRTKPGRARTADRGKVRLLTHAPP